MTTTPDLSRKVQQFGNDVDAMYEMLHAIQITQGRHGLRLGEIVDAQVAQGTTLDQHTAVLDQHAAVLDQHTTTLAEHGATLAEHTTTLAEHGSKLDRIIALLESR